MLRENGGILDQLSELTDLLLIGVGFFLAVALYEWKGVITNADVPLNYFIFFLSYIVFWVLSSNINRTNRSRRYMSVWRELEHIFKTHLIAFTLCLSLLALYDPKFINNRFFFYFGTITFLLVILFHILVRAILQTIRLYGKNTRYILLLGSGEGAEMYLEKIKDNPQLGYKVIGYLAPKKNGINLPYLGDYSQLESVMKLKIVDLTVVTALISDEGIKDCLDLLDIMGKNVVIMLDDMVSKVARSRPVDFDGLSMVAYDGHPRKPWHELVKRFMDFSLTAIGLVAISPFLLIIAIVIKLTSKGPVIFYQERVGVNGRIFKMYKFRSMVQNAEELKSKLASLNEMSGPVFKIKNDPRVTTVGKFLRKTSLDELPQLWNVLKGDMSLVGPRPPLPSEVDMYNPKHRKRLAVKPGITCIWQISGRNDVDFEQWMEMDADYVDRWSLWLDVEILAKTVPVVLMRKGAS